MTIQRRWLKRRKLWQVKRMRIERIEMFGGQLGNIQRILSWWTKNEPNQTNMKQFWQTPKVYATTNRPTENCQQNFWLPKIYINFLTKSTNQHFPSTICHAQDDQTPKTSFQTSETHKKMPKSNNNPFCHTRSKNMVGGSGGGRKNAAGVGGDTFHLVFACDFIVASDWIKKIDHVFLGSDFRK